MLLGHRPEGEHINLVGNLWELEGRGNCRAQEKPFDQQAPVLCRLSFGAQHVLLKQDKINYLDFQVIAMCADNPTVPTSEGC